MRVCTMYAIGVVYRCFFFAAAALYSLIVIKILIHMSLCTEMYESMREGEQKNASATREGKRAGHRKTERKRTEE